MTVFLLICFFISIGVELYAFATGNVALVLVCLVLAAAFIIGALISYLFGGAANGGGCNDYGYGGW